MGTGARTIPRNWESGSSQLSRKKASLAPAKRAAYSEWLVQVVTKVCSLLYQEMTASLRKKMKILA